MLRVCDTCGNRMYYPRILCTRCMSETLHWSPASGRGVVYAVSVVHRAPDPSFRADVPYVLAIIELEEGPRMMSNVTNCDPYAVRIGMPVEVWFERAAEDVAIPKFRPVPERQGS